MFFKLEKKAPKKKKENTWKIQKQKLQNRKKQEAK